MPAASSAQAPFHVLAKPSGPLCNLACDYCFYLEKRGLFPDAPRPRMGDEVLEAFTRSYIESQPAGTPEVQFAWQGGEPTLLGLDFFRRAVALQRRHARPGMRVTNALQTNAVLLDEDWARFLGDHDFLVGVSLDGPEDLHDRWRRDAGGRGSFRRVMRGLRALSRRSVPFNTLSVVHARNGAQPRRLYAFFKEIGSSHLQFIPLVERNGSGLSARSIGGRAYGRFLSTLFDCWLEQRDVGRVFVRDFESALARLTGRGGTVCIHAATCGRSLCVEHDGSVFACDHYVEANRRLGSVLREPLGTMVEDSRQRAFGAAKRERLPGACRDCRHLALCGGGCPKDREPATGRNHLCAGYALFFDHALPTLQRLAGARGPARNDPCPCGSGRKHKRCCLVHGG
jgi:uncharacterized protein